MHTERQVVVLGTQLCAAQAKLAYLTSQCDYGRGRVTTVSTECDVTSACEVTATGNLSAAEVAWDALCHNDTRARRGGSQTEKVLIILCTEVDDCLGASNLCLFITPSDVHIWLGTFMSVL